jgi:hypothetical protein
MPSTAIDPASVAALNAVAHALEIDQTRAVRHATNGYTWWIAPGLRQRVTVETGPPHGTRWLRIETPVWRRADPATIAPLLDALRRHARGAAVLHAPKSGNTSLVTRFPLPASATATRARALAGTGAIQAFLAAWAWGEARTQFGARAAAWRDAIAHPELGMDTPPDPVLTYRDRVLRPGTAEREGTFADALLAATAEAIERTGSSRHPVQRFTTRVGSTHGAIVDAAARCHTDQRHRGLSPVGTTRDSRQTHGANVGSRMLRFRRHNERTTVPYDDPMEPSA